MCRSSLLGQPLLALLAFAALGTPIVASCSNRADDCYWRTTCSDSGAAARSGAPTAEAGAGGSDALTGSGGDAGTRASGGRDASNHGDAGSGAVGPRCDTDALPSAGGCVDESVGVFVSAANGDDRRGDGSRARPFATIGRGIEAAVSANVSNLFVCADGGVYAESLQFDEAADGLRVSGGFRCEDWSYDAALKAAIRSPDPVALVIENVTGGLVLEDLDVLAADAAPGESSFGAIVRSSAGVYWLRVSITAGSGGRGRRGEAGAPGEEAPEVSDTQRGRPATCSDAPVDQRGGLWETASTCGSMGGRGGSANRGDEGSAGLAGSPREHVTPPGVDNRGKEGDGQPGSPGDPGEPGAPEPSTGTFDANGFTAPPDAGGGTDGFPGQGGGGGHASHAIGKAECIGASGGAGGMGGCGGKGGQGGSAGGASVALLSWDSTLQLDGCALNAGAGGNGGPGGNGGAGSPGRPGAEGGEGDSANGIGPGSRGGAGGDGGNGGPGAGGNGGPSYALVYHGDRPTLSSGTLLHAGTPGAAGLGGIAGSVRAPSGQNGDAARELHVE